MKINRVLWLVVVAASLLLLAISAVLPGRTQDGVQPIFAGGRSHIPKVDGPFLCEQYDPEKKTWAAIETAPVPIDDNSGKRFIRLLRPGSYRVSVEASTTYVRVISPAPAYIAAAGMLLLLISFPCAFLRTDNKDEAGRPISAWYELLSEPGGGYSLARMQLVIWFVPAIVIYTAASLPMHEFAEITASMAVLLGMSGATTLLGAAANPAQIRPATAPLAGSAAAPSPFPPHPPAGPSLTVTGNALPKPSFTDLVKDWQDHGDLSRYQFLLLTLLGAALLLVHYFDYFTFPELPTEFLALIGASQATYLGTKAVKTGRMDSGST